jgi:hypothetical protein
MNQIVTCPACAKELQVPEDFLGKTVQCPECKEQFVADPGPAPGVAPAPASMPTSDLFPAREKASYALDDDGDDRRRPRKRGDDDEYDRPRKRRDDDEYERPRRRAYLAPHRGGMILAFGILAIVGILTIVFGPLAWIMGNADLAAMRAGRMDPSGEGQTNTGRILGMIATLLTLLALIAGCVLVAFLFIAGLAGGAAGRR